MTGGTAGDRGQTRRVIDLEHITEDALLEQRICDLPLKIEGTFLESCVKELYRELQAKGIVFHPVCYLGDEWMTPVNEPVLSIPFYLSHPTLLKLEIKMMLEAEGSDPESCMRLLRHETGHALSYAYRLQRRKKWQQVFGSSDKEYGDTFKFRPYSKNYVSHLHGFYAQYHPDEDFVETFAVWLTPDSNWKEEYAGWGALAKLEYVDDLMRSIKDRPPLVARGRKLWNYRDLRITLKNFYRKKKKVWAEDFPDFHDDNLRKIFAPTPSDSSETSRTATRLIRQYQKTIIAQVSLWTGEKKYVINNLLKTVLLRCRELRLMYNESESIVLLRFVSYVTTQIMNYAYTGWFRGDKAKRMK